MLLQNPEKTGFSWAGELGLKTGSHTFGQRITIQLNMLSDLGAASGCEVDLY